MDQLTREGGRVRLLVSEWRGMLSVALDAAAGTCVISS